VSEKQTGEEKEFKFPLFQLQYERLLQRLNFSEPVRQRNFYFDTFDLDLNDSNFMIRIREERNEFEATLKHAASLHTKYFNRKEINVALAREQAIGIIRGKTQELFGLFSFDPLDLWSVRNDIYSDELQRIGVIENRRSRRMLPSGLVLELDHFSCAGKDFFELECEFMGDYAPVLAELQSLGLQRPSKGTKRRGTKFGRLVEIHKQMYDFM